MAYRTVIHLQWSVDGEEHHEYYGSISSLYDRHTSEELGITSASLNNYFHIHPDTTFKITKKGFIIRRGELYVKENNRGRKKSTE